MSTGSHHLVGMGADHVAEEDQLCCYTTQHEEAFCKGKPQDGRVRPELEKAQIAAALIGVE